MPRRTCAAHEGLRSRVASTPFSAEARRHCAGRAAAPCRRGARKTRVRVVSAVAALVGLALIGALVVYFGADAVIRLLLAVGWAGVGRVCLMPSVLVAC